MTIQEKGKTTKTQKTIKAAFLGLSLLLTAVFAVWQSLLLTKTYDFATHTYQADSVSHTVMLCLLGAAAVFFLAGLLLFRGEESDTFGKKSPLLVVSSVLCGLTLLAVSFLFFKRMLTSDLPFAGYADKATYGLWLGASVLALPSAGWFFLTAFGKGKPSRNAVLLSFCPIAFSALFLISVYYDKTVRIGSPLRILDQLALVVVMLAFLYESRVHMGRTKTNMTLVTSLLALPFLGITALPHVILSFGQALSHESAAFFFLSFCILYFTARLLSFPSKADADEIQADAPNESIPD